MRTLWPGIRGSSLSSLPSVHRACQFSSQTQPGSLGFPPSPTASLPASCQPDSLRPSCPLLHAPHVTGPSVGSDPALPLGSHRELLSLHLLSSGHTHHWPVSVRVSCTEPSVSVSSTGAFPSRPGVAISPLGLDSEILAQTVTAPPQSLTFVTLMGFHVFKCELWESRALLFCWCLAGARDHRLHE